MVLHLPNPLSDRGGCAGLCQLTNWLFGCPKYNSVRGEDRIQNSTTLPFPPSSYIGGSEASSAPTLQEKAFFLPLLEKK